MQMKMQWKWICSAKRCHAVSTASC